MENCKRDFTYVDDILEGIKCAPEKKTGMMDCQCHNTIYNIGSSNPENLLDFVQY